MHLNCDRRVGASQPTGDFPFGIRLTLRKSELHTMCAHAHNVRFNPHAHHVHHTHIRFNPHAEN